MSITSRALIGFFLFALAGPIFGGVVAEAYLLIVGQAWRGGISWDGSSFFQIIAASYIAGAAPAGITGVAQAVLPRSLPRIALTCAIGALASVLWAGFLLVYWVHEDLAWQILIIGVPGAVAGLACALIVRRLERLRPAPARLGREARA